MKNYLLILFIVLTSCSQNCKDLPSSYKNYDDAKTVVLRTDFKFSEETDVSESSFITSADYYSCDGLVGYFVIGMNDKKYIFQNMPYEVWKGFKNAKSKGIFYNREIRGRYRLRLK